MSTSCEAHTVPDQAFALARQMNTQINQLECSQNMPVVNSRPLRLGLDISNVCNINCIFCLAKGGRLHKNAPGAFRDPAWLEHFEPLLPFVEQVIFSSYEALLNPQFDAFVHSIRRYATPFQLFSNGMAMTPDVGAFLLENGMNSLWLSFHGAREKTYHSIMRGANYETVLRNLLALKHHARKKQKTFELRLVFCAMRRTLPELVEYVDLARRVGATDIQVNYLLVTEQGTSLDRESVFFCQDEYDYAVLNAKMQAAKYGIALHHQPLFSEALGRTRSGACHRPWQHLNVKHNGNVEICCGGSPVLGNLFEDGFAKVWNSPKMTAFRMQVNTDNPPRRAAGAREIRKSRTISPATSPICGDCLQPSVKHGSKSCVMLPACWQRARRRPFQPQETTAGAPERRARGLFVIALRVNYSPASPALDSAITFSATGGGASS